MGHTPAPTCAECGHAIPPEDPTNRQIDAFLDDDATEGCETCSRLWLAIMFAMMDRVLAEKR